MTLSDVIDINAVNDLPRQRPLMTTDPADVASVIFNQIVALPPPFLISHFYAESAADVQTIIEVPQAASLSWQPIYRPRHSAAELRARSNASHFLACSSVPQFETATLTDF